MGNYFFVLQQGHFWKCTKNNLFHYCCKYNEKFQQMTIISMRNKKMLKQQIDGFSRMQIKIEIFRYFIFNLGFY
jgi:hypothetical protein